MADSILRRAASRVYWSLPRRTQTRLRSALGPALLRRALRAVPAVEPIPAGQRRPVSIVVPSYDDLPYLRALLASLRATLDGWDHEVIVVDDSCIPSVREALTALQDDRVRVVLREERGGFGKAVNSGLAEARHDVMLLNSDIVARPGWLDALQRAAYGDDPRVGMVSGMLVYPDGLIQYGGTYHTRRTNPQWFGHLWVGRRANDPEANEPAYLIAPSGACVYVRREVLEEIGGFDEEYWLGFEDVDWGVRARRAGWRVRYEPAAKLIHHESASRGYSQGRRELASMRHFWSRWREGMLDRADLQPRATVLVTSDAAPALWRRWAEELVTGLRALGRDAELVEVAAGAVDEALVARIADARAVPVAVDSGAVRTAWLAGDRHGVSLQLLPGGDPVIGARETSAERAGWRPEFDFVAPSAVVADRLRAASSWAPRAVIAPVLAPADAGPASGRTAVAVVGAVPPATDAVLRRVAGDALVRIEGAEVDPALLARVAAAEARVVVCFERFEHALAPLALVGSGAAFLGAIGTAPTEVMDGLTALLVDPADPAAVERSLRDLVERDDVVDEVAANAAQTARELAAAAPRALARAIDDSLDRA